MSDRPTVYVVGANESQIAAMRKAAENAGLAFSTGLPVQNDPVTHLLPFTSFEGHVIEEIGKANSGAPVSLALVHLDQFQVLNRSHGHMCGDLLLLEVANLLRESIPENAIAARYSGGQLALLCPATDGAGAKSWAESFVVKVRNFNFRAVAIGEKVTVTIGLVTFPSSDVTGSEQLLEVLTARTFRGAEAGGDRVSS